MAVLIFNLRPALEATRESWTARLDEMFARHQFILGPQVAEFECEFAGAMSAKYAVGVANGTDAIELCLRDAGLTSQKQEVITTAITAPFSGIGIKAAGARIRFADVNPKTLQIDADDLGNRISKKTAALMPVHLYGQPCEIARIASMARAERLTLIQDACQAHGATVAGKPFTAFGSYVAYSFYPTKNLGCLGDGGAIVTNRPAIHKRLRELHDGGRRGGQVSHVAGINSRLDEMQACYLRAFLPRLTEWNDHRRRIARLYDEGLRDCPGVTLIERTADSVGHLYVIRAARRDKLREALAAKSIGTGIHYPVPMHLHPAFAECGLRKGDLPHAEKACKEILSLPVWPYLPDSSALEVVEAIRAFYRA
ncbi:MAG: DegT/DnrJ/EryC1/StrS family aminotransferase [Bryobacterales bacterium]|nr:DegT/DnrJ/EryC1/StrS family aminotransferase [Bryobacterales bacterium]